MRLTIQWVLALGLLAMGSQVNAQEKDSLTTQKTGSDTLAACSWKGKKCRAFKPSAGMHGLSFDLGQAGDALGIRAIDDINGNESLLYKYVSSKQAVYRLGFGVKGGKYSRSMVDSVGQARVTVDSTYKSWDLYLAPGYEHHFKGNKRLDPYIGGQLEWGFLGKGQADKNTLIDDTTGVVTQTVSMKTTRGASLGVHAMAGFNYYIGQHLAIGAEYRLGYQHLFGGGDWERTTIDKPLSGVSVVQNDEGSDVIKNGVLGLNSFAGITLSWYFTTKDDCPAQCKAVQ